MSKIVYDPTKDRFAHWIRRSRLLRLLFYKTLDLFFLRSWYVKAAFRKLYKEAGSKRSKWEILDAGSGFGQYDHFILKAFPEATIYALDIKKDYLDDCRTFFKNDISEGRISFEFHDLTSDELSAKSFDVALCVDVLEHIEDDVGVMQRVQRALRPGGWFVMHSPSHYSKEDANGEDFFVDEHARAGYSEKELSEKLKQSGLEPVELRYTYGKWGHAAWKILVKKPMIWFTRFGMKTMIWLPFYYVATLIPGIVMMGMDQRKKNIRGTGILGLAKKADGKI